MSIHPDPVGAMPTPPGAASPGERLLLAQERQRRLHDIIAAVNLGLGLDDILRLVRDAAVEAGGFDRAGVLLVEESAGVRQVRGVWGTSARRERRPRAQVGHQPRRGGSARAERVPYLLTRDGDSPDRVPPGWQGRTVVPTARLPLRSGGETVGILSVDNLLSGRPSPPRMSRRCCRSAKRRRRRCRARGATRRCARRSAASARCWKRCKLVAVILDSEGDVTFCNDFLLRLTGWEREEVLGQNWFDRFLPAEQREEVRRAFRLNIAQRRIWAHQEDEIVTRRGERRLISWSNVLLHDAEGNVRWATSIGEDVTERRRLEGQIAAAYERERRIAETLQRSLLLQKPDLTFPGLETDALHEVALEEATVGGDFFDVFALSDDKVALVVGDASGKGLAAAARTVEVKYALRAFLREYPYPARTLARLNQPALRDAAPGQPQQRHLRRRVARRGGRGERRDALLGGGRRAAARPAGPTGAPRPCRPGHAAVRRPGRDVRHRDPGPAAGRPDPDGD